MGKMAENDMQKPWDFDGFWGALRSNHDPAESDFEPRPSGCTGLPQALPKIWSHEYAIPLGTEMSCTFGCIDMYRRKRPSKF